jgi:hypothetical protein
MALFIICLLQRQAHKMSTLKTISIIHPSGSTNNIVSDSSGNVAVGGSVSDSKGEVRTVPANSQTSAYNVASTDAGQFISITTGGVSVLTTTAFTTGQSVSIYNNSGSNQTITQGASVTIRQVGTANTGNRTLAQYGLCTLLCVASNTYIITGGGVS